MAECDLISKTALLRHLDMAIDCKDCPRNADKELYKCVHNPTSERCTCSDIAQICIRITKFATFADVQPVKRGEWEKKSSVGVFRCSLCQHIFMLGADEIDEYHFCPNCGARMIKEG